MHADMTLFELKDALSRWKSGEIDLFPTPEGMKVVLFMEKIRVDVLTEDLTEDPTMDIIGAINSHLITIQCVKYCLENNVQF